MMKKGANVMPMSSPAITQMQWPYAQQPGRVSKKLNSCHLKMLVESLWIASFESVLANIESSFRVDKHSINKAHTKYRSQVIVLRPSHAAKHGGIVLSNLYNNDKILQALERFRFYRNCSIMLWKKNLRGSNFYSEKNEVDIRCISSLPERIASTFIKNVVQLDRKSVV